MSTSSVRPLIYYKNSPFDGIKFALWTFFVYFCKVLSLPQKQDTGQRSIITITTDTLKSEIWHIIRITEGREKHICNLLDAMGYATFVPMRKATYRQKNVTLPLLRGLIWTQAPYSVTEQLRTAGIHHLKTATGQPIEITNGVFADFKLLAAHPKARFLTNKQACQLCNGQPAGPETAIQTAYIEGEPHWCVWLQGICAVAVPRKTAINIQKYTL